MAEVSCLALENGLLSSPGTKEAKHEHTSPEIRKIRLVSCTAIMPAMKQRIKISEDPEAAGTPRKTLPLHKLWAAAARCFGHFRQRPLQRPQLALLTTKHCYSQLPSDYTWSLLLRSEVMSLNKLMFSLPRTCGIVCLACQEQMLT